MLSTTIKIQGIESIMLSLFAILLPALPQCRNALGAQPFEAGDIARRDTRRVRVALDGLAHLVFAKKMQDRIGRAIGIIFERIGLGPLELVVRVERSEEHTSELQSRP